MLLRVKRVVLVCMVAHILHSIPMANVACRTVSRQPSSVDVGRGHDFSLVVDEITKQHLEAAGLRRSMVNFWRGLVALRSECLSVVGDSVQ